MAGAWALSRIVAAMPPLQATLFAALGAVILGLVIFAGLLLVGLAIIRALRLPQDLPEGPRFEPPPPDIREPSDRAAAVAIASERNRLREQLAQAHAAISDGAVCQETLAALDAFPGKDDPVHATAVADLRAAATLAIAAGNEAEQLATRLRGQPADAASAAQLADLATRAASARRAVDEACARLPDGGGNRRLIWMLVLLAVMVAWLVAMRALMHG